MRIRREMQSSTSLAEGEDASKGWVNQQHNSFFYMISYKKSIEIVY